LAIDIAPERDVRGIAGPVAFAGSLAILLSAAPASAAPASGDAAHVAVPSERLSPLVALPRVANAAPEMYTVVAGDTVSTIAARFGLRTADVLALNGLSWSSSVIYAGQSLRLTGAASPAPPAAPPSTAATTVQAGDTVSAIASRHGVSTQALLDANGLTWSSIIYPGQALTLPGAASPAPPTAAAPPPAPPAPPSAASYTVQSGDTISAIAQRHGTSTQAVLDANGLTRDAVIYPGQSIALPGEMALASAPAPSVAGLDSEQIANARVIIQVGRELGVSDRGIAIALGTAMQESWIRNLDWGDRDSLGLFQQRPSTGWGSAEQIRDPHRSTRVFYGGPGDPNGHATRGLLDIPGWEAMTFAQAAQAVQISAYPDRYAQWEEPAYAWLAALG
jgi:LysM repeat protein